MDIRIAAFQIEARIGTRPRCVLACFGGTDEHWQLYHPEYPDVPMVVLTPEGELMPHPDWVG